MDPDAVLDDLRDALAAARMADDLASTDDAPDAEVQQVLAWQAVGDAFDILDGWLSGGGFLPAKWAQKPRL